MLTSDELRALTRQVVDAMEQVVDGGGDFADWLAGALATVASRHGSTLALVARRPGSWESGLVLDLVRGTVGHDDDLLPAYFDAELEDGS